MNPVFNFALLAAASVPAFLLPGSVQAQTRDYPALAKSRQANFAALPAHELSRLYDPESGHIEAPTATRNEIIRWNGEVSARP